MILVILIFGFIIPPKIYANVLTEAFAAGLDDAAGVIMEPLYKFVEFVADSIMQMLEKLMLKNDADVVVGSIDDITTTSKGTGAEITIDNMEEYENALGFLPIEYPNFHYSPEEIFSGEIDLLDIDFISGNNSDNNWLNIRNGVASWYKVLRLIALAGLLSMLIYTGIKITLSANAQDKSKYKERLLNWLIAIILLFTMHYLMTFIISVINEIAKVFTSSFGEITVHLKRNGTEIGTFNTNLIGLARFKMQQLNFSSKMIYLVVYVALIVFTLKFTWTYIRRVLYMAFLTLTAPIVALMYPLDKMNGGSSSSFDMWLKEFFYNVLLQPIHALLYIILISSALTLAAENFVYALVALGFVASAERLLKQIFGFGKARLGTMKNGGGVVESFAAGTLASNLINTLGRRFGFNKTAGGNTNLNNSGDNGEMQLPMGVIEDNDMSIFSSNLYDENYDLIGTQSAGNIQFNQQDNQIGNPSIDLDNKVEKLREKIKELFDLNDYKFNFENNDNRSIEEIFDEINRLQRLIDNRNISDEDRAMYERQLNLDKALLSSNIISGENQFSRNGLPLNYLDNDTRSSQELMDSIINKNYQGTRLGVTKSQGRPILKEAKNEMQILKDRMAQNDYIRNHNEIESIENNEYQRRQMNQRNDRELENVQNQPSVANGLKAVGKKIIKPVWDTDKMSKGYNGKRLVKRAAKAIAMGAVGTTAAAVQAGISITDGKYNPLEGVGSFAGGAYATNAAINAVKRGFETPVEKQSIEKYKDQWVDRDDVIDFYNIEYGNDAKDMRNRAKNNYVSRGITDVKEQSKAMKFANKLIEEGRVYSQEEADKIAVATLRYRNDLISKNNYGVLYDSKREKGYLDHIEKQESSLNVGTLNNHRTALEMVRKFESLNN